MEYKEIKFLSKGAFFSSTGKIIAVFLGYLYLFILTRFLGPYWLGMYALGITIIQGLSLLSQMGLPFSLLHFIPIYRSTNDYSRLKGMLWFSLGLTFLVSCLLSLLLLFSAKFVAQHLVKDNNFIRPLQLFSLVVPLLSIHMLTGSILRAIKNIKAMTLLQCIPAFLSIILFFALVRYFTMSIFAAIIAYNSAYFIAVGFGAKMLLFRLPSIVKKEIEASMDVGKILPYALPLLFFGSMHPLFTRIDILMLGYFLPERMVGIYNPALQLSLLASFGLYMFNRPFAPLISEYYHHKKIKELSSLYQVTTRWIFICGFPCFLFLILLGKEILLIFGEQFTQGYCALIILSTGQLINAGVGSAGLLLIMTGHQRFVLGGTVCASIINVGCNIILIPRLGIIGAAIGTAVAVTLFNIMNISYVKKTINIQPYNAKFCKPLVSGGISFFLIFFMKRFLPFADYKLELIILGGLLFIIFGLVSVALRFEEQEKYIFALFKKRLFDR